MNHAIIDKTGEVVNVVCWEGAEWLPPRGHMVVRSDIASIGDKYDHESGIFMKETGKRYHRDLDLKTYLDGEGEVKD